MFCYLLQTVTIKSQKILDFMPKTFVAYNMIKKGNNKNMSYLELESVGSFVTTEGDVYPMTGELSDLCPLPGSGVNIFECSDEWYWNLSLVDGYKLLSFLDENIGWSEDSQIHGGYEEWKEKVKGLMGQPDTLVEVV